MIWNLLCIVTKHILPCFVLVLLAYFHNPSLFSFFHFPTGSSNSFMSLSFLFYRHKPKPVNFYSVDWSVKNFSKGCKIRQFTEPKNRKTRKQAILRLCGYFLAPCHPTAQGMTGVKRSFMLFFKIEHKLCQTLGALQRQCIVHRRPYPSDRSVAF